MSNLEIFQVYYHPDQIKHLDPAFIPYDNTANTAPEYREWPHIQKIYQDSLLNGREAWGITSWKFNQKSLITGDKFIKFIQDNPGHDVYFVNPTFILEATSFNVWEQGEQHHNSITAIAQGILEKTKYSHVKLAAQINTSDHYAMCSYFYATRKFWDEYTELVRAMVVIANADKEYHKALFEISANYAFDKNVGYFPFIVERFLSVIMKNRPDLKSIGYEHSIEELEPRIPSDFFNELKSMSLLKKKASEYNDTDLLQIWHVQRSLFKHRFPAVITLE